MKFRFRPYPKRFANAFLPESGAEAFFASIILWGIGVGCFAAALNNFLADIYSIGGYGRGWIEFFRELPGLMLVFILAIISKMSDWRIMKLGVLVSMAAVCLMFANVGSVAIAAFIMCFSAGEHIVMPVRSAIAMRVAKRGKEGTSLGFMTSCINAGTVSGGLVVAAVFWICGYFGLSDSRTAYNFVWAIIAILLVLSFISTFTPHAPNEQSKKPKLYFRKKFSKFYILELFYGARKQIFLTFGPYLLIVEYGFDTAKIAALLSLSAFVNVFGSPLIGKITDRFGYRNIMIYDTVILFFVCMMYGYAGKLFPHYIAVWVLCVNYVLDNLMSTTSMATNIYASKIAANKEELTSTLTSGISINHLISILCAPIGGWVWTKWGVEWLFSFAALMALANSAFALTIPKVKAS